ncbi:MAG: amino acid permease [Candidatus Omnitrophica bacterium]|nr:amino acid permease [Candidatus Omnitrophota bacterium]
MQKRNEVRSADAGGLKRSLGTIALIIYGVGDILGAGIYALVGKAAGIVGPACWISFVIAFVVASLTGLTYAELGSRYPRSAGAAIFTLRAFQKPSLSYAVGFLVMVSGIGSMATVSRAIVGYILAVLPDVPAPLIIIIFFGILTVINVWGIEGSSLVNIFCTAIEVTGILIVIVAGMKFFGTVNYLEITPPSGVTAVDTLLSAGILAFYAFIGFEDIVNVAEETKNPSKIMPQAIIISLVIMAVIYIATAVAAVSAVPVSELASSQAPLMAVVKKGFPNFPPMLFTLIALFAVTNTALVNYIMSSRILYGMSEEKLMPAYLSRVHPKYRTPHWAILTVLVIVTPLALSGTIVRLAQSTSLILLIVFSLMNLSLLFIKWRDKEKPPFSVPFGIPAAGLVCCLSLIFYVKPEAFMTVGILILIGFVLYGVTKLGILK